MLVFLIVGVGTTWAEEVTFSYGDYKGQGTSSTGSAYTMNDKSYVSVGESKFYGNTSYAQFYAGGTITVTPKNGATITKIAMTTTGTSYNGYQSSGKYTASTGSVAKNTSNNAIVEWTGSATSAFTLGHDKQIRWTSIVVTYTISGTPVAKPTNLSAGTPTSTGTTLSWDAVEHATAYKVEYKVSSASSWIAVTPNPTTTSCTISGLTPSTTYAWQVTALSTETGYKDGSAQSGSNFTTAAPPSHKAYFYVNGTLQNEGGTSYIEGAAITFPSDPADIDGKKFQGWTQNQNYSNATTAPSDMTKSATMGDGDQYWYAVFATQEGAEITWTEIFETPTEGTYAICSDSYFMKAEISSNRFANGSSTPQISEGKLTTVPAADCIWEISKPDTYYRIKNGTNYAGGTNTKNQGTLLTDASANLAKWSISYETDHFEVINYGRSIASSDPNNKYLRNNGTNGWATYVSSTGSAPRLFKKGGGTTYSDYCTTVDATKTPTSLSWSASTASATINGSNTFPTLSTTPADLSGVTYSSSNTDVATINVNTGEINLVAAGETTITATYAGNDTYAAATPATYTLTVNPAPDLRAEVNLSTFTAASTTLVKGNTTTTTVTNDQIDWTPIYTYSTSNDQVATVDASGVITAVAKGTARITVSLNVDENDANYKAGSTTSMSVDITVNNPTHTAHFSVNGSIDNNNDKMVEEGDAITFPADPEFAEVVFMGWTTSPIVGTQDAEPTMVDKASTTMSTSDITYYAVFATANGGTEGYNNVTSLTVGKKYIFGAVKAAASSTLAANTTFGAVAFTNTYNSTTGGTWGAKVDLTPDAQGSIAADNSSITDACIWTLESVTSGNYAFKNGSNYIYLGTSAGSSSAAQAGVSTTGGNMYIEDVNSTCKNAFLLHPSSTSTNVMLYNTSSGYRMYASRAYSATMSPYVRFYEYDPGTTYTDYCTTVSTKLTPTLSFAEATYEATVGEAFEAPQLTMTEGISVTYSSSETSVATVNATTGEVVLVAAGTTIITATFAGNDDYKPATASYTLNVAAATPVFASLEELVAADLTSGTEVTVTFENVAIKAFQAVGSTRKGVYFDIQKGGNDIEIYYSDAVPAEWVVGGTLSGTLTNCPWKLYNSTWELAPASGWAWANLTYNAPANYAPAFTTQPVSATYEWNATAQNLTVAASGNPAPTYQWYSNTTNSNENGTVIEGQTNVTYKPSTATAGTFYYYCVATNSEGYAASDVAVITVNDPVVASLPFAFDGGKSDIASTDGMSQSGLGSDYNLSPKLKFDSEGDNVVIQYNEAAKKVTYTIKGNSTSGTYAFDVMESADGVNYTTVHSHTSVTDEASYTDNLASTSRFVKFVYTTKASGNVALGKISIVAASVLDDPEFDFEQSTYTFFTDKDMQVVATSAAGSTGAITYALTAGDEDEFLIDDNTGEIACYTPGTYTVTATIAETAEFASATATCTVKVLAPVVGNSIIVAETDGGCYAMATTCDGAYFTHKAIKKAGDKYVVNSLDDILFCTHTSDGKTTIQSTSNAQYVQATAAKNISYTETEYLWTNDGEKLTAATADHGTLQYNTSNPRFTTYATKVGQYATIVDLSNVYVGILLDENDTDVEELDNTYETVAVNRTLKADTWNTFCVPFGMSAEDIVSNFGEGAKVKELDGLTVSGVNFNMHFGDAESIEAGKPYMVKVATPVSSIIVNNAYVLTKVDDELYLDDTTVTDSEGNSLTFHGNYAKMKVPMGSFIISSNLFYYVDSEVNNKGFRGYITTEGADGTPAAARSLNYVFGNETEGIMGLDYQKTDRIYDAQGRIYNKLQRGVNIVNGKKILK